MNGTIRVRRVYESRVPADGLRVLVDRIWPRGLSKAAADLDEWCRDIAPSTELRRWYDHVPSRWPEFATRYGAELTDPSRALALEHLRHLAVDQDLALLTATRAITVSHAVVIAQHLTGVLPSA
jgi:uncharacterized protein YeaO (DUF488 family)